MYFYMDEIRRLVKTDVIKIESSMTELSHMHTHNFLEIAYVKSGVAEHILNGRKSKIRVGDFLIMDYNAVHSYKSIGEEPLEILNCLFSPEFIDKTLKNCKNFSEVVNNYMIKYNYLAANKSPANYIFSDKDGEILALLLKMKDEYENKAPGYHGIIRCALVEIIIRTVRMSALSLDASADGICDYIIRYTADNLSEKSILGSISAEVNFSVSYLSQKFKEKMGITFSEYLKRMRINEACRLLANTNKKIIDIASLLGYADIKFFNKIFKSHLGVTPRDFRRSSR